MGLLQQNEKQYYVGRKEFEGDGTTTVFTVTEIQEAFHGSLSVAPGTTNEKVKLFVDGDQYPQHYLDTGGAQQVNYSFGYDIINGWL